MATGILENLNLNSTVPSQAVPTTPVSPTVATAPTTALNSQQMAQNRANLVANSNGALQDVNGKVVPVITKSNLTPTTPLTVKPTSTSTTAPALSGSADASLATTQSTIEKMLADKTAADKASLGESKSTVTSIMDKILGVQNSRGDIESGLNIPEYQKMTNDAFTALQASKRSQEKELLAAQQASGGTTAGAADAISAINRKYAFEQADLSISLDVANRNYTAAQQTADRKIQLALEPLQTQLDFQKMFYEDNRDNLSKDEQNQLQLLIDKNKRELDTKESNLKDVSSVQLEAAKNGAPLQVQQAISKAVNAQEAITAAGQYLKNPTAGIDLALKNAQLANINSEIAKRNAETKSLNIPQITNPAAGQYSTALNVILGSSKFTKEQKKSVVDSINSGQDPVTVIKNQAKNIMGQTEATTLTKYEVAKDTLTDIGNQLSEFYSAGGNTSLISGSFEKVINKLGEVKDPKLVQLATQIQGNLQVYRNAISGTAYSQQEGRDISSIFPGINKSQDLNSAILKGRSLLFDSIIDSMYRSALGKTYDDLKGGSSTSSGQSSARLTSPDGKSYVNTSELSSAQLDEAKKAGWK